MVRLTTQQPVAAAGSSKDNRIVTLRSGFYAIPFNLSSTLKIYIFLRSHKSMMEGIEVDLDEAAEGMTLFLTGLPYGSTTKSIKSNLIKLFPTNKINNVQLLPSSTAHDYTDLYDHEKLSSTLESNALVTPLFNDSISTPASTSTFSALVTFLTSPSLPPSLPSTTLLTWSTPTLPSYISIASSRYSLARPHRSTVIAHSDSWMTAFDKRKSTSTATALATSLLSHEVLPPVKIKKEKLKRDKSGKIIKPVKGSGIPLPGSAAHALLVHTNQLAVAANRTINPDEVVEENWTMVSRGGKHGKSLLLPGVNAGLQGYGGAVVGIAKKRKLGEEVESPKETKMIVGEGFYRFRKDEKRRDGSFSPSLLSRRCRVVVVMKDDS
jgi:hypothetical protein